MNILVFGATGMAGQGVLRECLLDPEVQHVLTIGRSAGHNKTGIDSPKLHELGNVGTGTCEEIRLQKVH